MDEREVWIQKYIQQQIGGMTFGSEVERQHMMQRERTTVSMNAPTAQSYARQFPSIYGEEGQVPDWMGGGRTGGLSPAAEMFYRH